MNLSRKDRDSLWTLFGIAAGVFLAFVLIASGVWL